MTVKTVLIHSANHPAIPVIVFVITPSNSFEQTPYEDSFVDVEYTIEDVSHHSQKRAGRIERHSVNTLLLS